MSTPSANLHSSVDTDDDPTADAKWNAGCDFAMTQLCKFLGVEPNSVSWDAATETVDGDVQAVIGNILRAKFSENWGPAERRFLIDALDALEAIDSEIVLTGHLKELVDCALAARNADFSVSPQTLSVPASSDEVAAFIINEFAHIHDEDARRIARSVTDTYSVSRPEGK